MSSQVQVSQLAALTQAAETAGRLPDLVVISPRSQADAIATDATTATALRQWKTRSQISWVDVTDSGRHDWFGMEET